MKHGIYFNLPEAEYHAVDALSKSLIKKSMISSADAYQAIYGEPKEPTSAMIYGSAIHKLILEGREKFEAEYCKGFDKREFPDALDTVADLKAWLDSEEIEYKKSSSKSVLSAMVADAQETCAVQCELIDVLKHKHQRKSEGKTELSSYDFDQIIKREWIAENYDFGGKRFNEVSLFWFDEYLECECKARLDAVVFTKDGPVIWDLKSFTNVSGKEINRCVDGEFASRGYYIDAAFYQRALLSVPVDIIDLDPPIEWPDKIEGAEFNLLFVEKTNYPNIRARNIVLSDGMGGRSELGQFADGIIKTEAESINEFRRSHGGKKPWNPIPQIQSIGIETIPLYLMD